MNVLRVLSNLIALYQVTHLLETREVSLELKRMDRVRASSERNSKIYRPAVPVLKSTQNFTLL